MLSAFLSLVKFLLVAALPLCTTNLQHRVFLAKFLLAVLNDSSIWLRPCRAVVKQCCSKSDGDVPLKRILRGLKFIKKGGNKLEFTRPN